jgi:hypothetical protein
MGFAIFLFTIATYIRTETLILVGLIVPYLFFVQFRLKQPIPKTLINIGLTNTLLSLATLEFRLL